LANAAITRRQGGRSGHRSLKTISDPFAQTELRGGLAQCCVTGGKPLYGLILIIMVPVVVPRSVAEMKPYEFGGGPFLIGS
jgi:hypothetical protein